MVTANPLLSRSGIPDFRSITADHVVPAVRRLLSDAESAVAAVEKSGKATWDGVIVPLEEVDDWFQRTWGVVNHLLGVQNSEALRKAHEEVQGEVVNFGLRVAQSEPIFRALKTM